MNWKMISLAVVVLLLLVVGFYGYGQSQPLSEEECELTMYAGVSAKEFGYWSLASLEDDLRECGYSGREIAMWHSADFAKDYSMGYMPVDAESGLRYKLDLLIIYESVKDIPDLFTTSEGIKCDSNEVITLKFVVEVEEDGNWRGGGPDEWDLKCVGGEE
ncbi:hypothetical protein A2572_01855 [Candidatus Collierbacteria bacterium RIFOXYD1_FULL_40_9]|uniref:Uncharacterized protein n=1 Tax=Candidatus Collierbacteria bacterium RIFOXYD1_FULL_40_9 TaxID=1817731 RepID=A0A1F5FV10_9BACT|nr:MAG: hypothetical protein A2572_01855 [Candidatus Collierbacteria bacterium RIFOXYD1_FULL_40_9]